DNVFHGIGPRSLQAERYRFGMDRIQARPGFELDWWKGSRMSAEAGFKYVAFRDDRCCDDPSLSRAIADGRVASPPSFDTGYSSVYQRGEITLDTRDERPKSPTGFRMELEVENGSNVRSSRS